MTQRLSYLKEQDSLKKAVENRKTELLRNLSSDKTLKAYISLKDLNSPINE